MYRDGMDVIGQQHPVFIVQTQMRHFQHELVRNEIFDMVSLFTACLENIVRCAFFFFLEMRVMS